MSKSNLPPPAPYTHPEPAVLSVGLGSAGNVHQQDFVEAAASASLGKRADRGAKVSAILVTFFVHVAVILILTLIILPALEVDVPQIQAKVIGPQSENIVEQTPNQATVKSKPSAASASARLLTSQATTSAVFLPTVNTETTLADFGAGSGVGLGMGFGGSGTGPGGQVGFFGQKSNARRVAFVIDYSLSMKGEREKLMRKELARSVEELKPGISYTLIFFAGPVWFAGEDLKNLGGPKTAVVRGHDGETYKWVSVKTATDWKLHSGKMPQVRWRDASGSNIRESLKHIKDSNLVWGTDWDDPLEIALDANPKPDVIYFMTDGIAGDRSMATAEAIARRAKSGNSKVVINCISMMEPKALEPMKVMAQRTGGQMTVIQKDGTRKVVIGPKK